MLSDEWRRSSTRLSDRRKNATSSVSSGGVLPRRPPHAVSEVAAVFPQDRHFLSQSGEVRHMVSLKWRRRLPDGLSRSGGDCHMVSFKWRRRPPLPDLAAFLPPFIKPDQERHILCSEWWRSWTERHMVSQKWRRSVPGGQRQLPQGETGTCGPRQSGLRRMTGPRGHRTAVRFPERAGTSPSTFSRCPVYP